MAGLVEVLSRLPELLALRRELLRRLVTARVHLFIGVDAPEFNLGIEAKLKRRGVRTMHFVSPSIWAWRRERVHKIRRSVHRMLALFPFEIPLYEAAGVPVTFVGHPLARNAAASGTRREARAQLKLSLAQPVFALLPGSRVGEIDAHSELLLKTAAELHAARPDIRFLIPLATRATRVRFEAAIYRLELDALPLTILYGHATDALRAADVALVASGTATLEAALARCPYVIYYRLSPVTAFIVRRKLLLPYVGLPNILAGKFVVPELLQEDATVENLVLAAGKGDQVGNLASDDCACLGQTERRLVGPVILTRSQLGRLAAISVQTSAEASTLSQKHNIDLLVQAKGDCWCGHVHVAEKDKLPDVRLGTVLQNLRAFAYEELATAMLYVCALGCDVDGCHGFGPLCFGFLNFVIGLRDSDLRSEKLEIGN